jgi:hypothetical protein
MKNSLANKTSVLINGSPIVHRRMLNGKSYEDKGTILKIEPPSLLVHTHWSPYSGLPDAPGNYQTVSYSLSKHPGGAELIISEDNIPTEEARTTSKKAWTAAQIP